MSISPDCETFLVAHAWPFGFSFMSLASSNVRYVRLYNYEYGYELTDIMIGTNHVVYHAEKNNKYTILGSRISCMNLETNVTDHQSFGYGSDRIEINQIHPNRTHMYSVGDDGEILLLEISPNCTLLRRHEKYAVELNSALHMWFSHDGNHIFTAYGMVYNSSEDESKDLQRWGWMNSTVNDNRNKHKRQTYKWFVQSPQPPHLIYTVQSETQRNQSYVYVYR